MKRFLAPMLLGLSACASIGQKDLSVRSQEGFTVKYTEFSPSTKKEIKKRSVIILPPTGGATYLESSYAKKLAQRGALVKVIKSWTGLGESQLDLGIHQKLHARAMRALGMVMETSPKGHQISVFGTSLGGIYSAVAAGSFERPDRVFVVAAGSPIPQIIGHSEHHSMTGLREKRFEEWSFKNKDQYADAIDKVFHLDPEDLPPHYKNKTLGMVVLLADEAVPTRYQKHLKNLWHPSKVISIDAGHFWGIVKAWWFYSKDIVEFLDPDKQ